MYSGLKVAEYVLFWHYKNGTGISNFKLQKVLYFIQAEFLVVCGHPAFADSIEAWEFGPVVSEVYMKYAVYGGCGIPYINKPYYTSITEKHRKLIDGVLEQCEGLSSVALTDLTTNQSPWQDTFTPNRHEVIPNNKIREYFLN